MPLPTNTAELSPMMKQYLKIKQQHMDELLFYRLGDFYEMFFDDALTASRELELTLTGRDCGLSERAPMCGVPFHSCEPYIARLVKRGYRVAICEQMEDPALAKGIVKRSIVRVVTPGTVTESSMLSEERNNYLTCVYLAEKGFGLAAADISTGCVYVTESARGVATLINELARFEPRELICNDRASGDKTLTRYASKQLGAVLQQLYAGNFDFDVAKECILRQFSGELCDKLLEFGAGNAVSALGALVKYVTDTQLDGASRLIKLCTYRCEEYMDVSAQCRRNLELTSSMRSGERRGSLLWVMDRTSTAMGKRLLRARMEKPLVDETKINARLDAVEELVRDSVLLSRLTEQLKKTFDIERLITKVVYKSCTPRDVNAIAATSEILEELKKLSASFSAPLLLRAGEELDTLADLRNTISDTLSSDPPALMKDGGYVRFGFSKEVDELRELLHNTKGYLTKLEQKLKEQTGIKTLKVGYNKVFGYYIEVSRGSTDAVPDYFIRKQTLTTGERYITEELKELENRIIGASERLNALEREIFEGLRQTLESNLCRIQATADAVAEIDVACGLALLAAENNYCRPFVDSTDVIEIENGRHPVVEKVLDGELFVPNDALLDCKKNLVAIITGPNMAGKSTYMRSVALTVFMAQMGSFVPATSAHIGVCDALFCRVGASDDIFSGDSTFMVEMREVAEILRDATNRSLVVLDEIGRGTSTYDGMSIARAVVEQICRPDGLGAKTMFATHYHELTDLETQYDNVRNYNIAARKRGDDIVFLRRIVKGHADESYGIEVAKLAGLPDVTIEAAKRILASIESGERALDAPRSAKEPKSQSNSDRIKERLKKITVETLTPLEAMYELADLVKLAEETDGDEDE